MQLLSQVFSVKMLYRQLITTTLSIYKNFSLGLLCKALHNKPKGCKVPWALRGGIAVIAMTAAEPPENRLHRFLLFSPDSRCFAKHRQSGGSEKSNVFAACP